MSFRPDVWTAANDGSGSNLDADKLDNLSSSDFALVAHTHAIDDLDDVTETTPATAHFLRFDGAIWRNATPSVMVADLNTQGGLDVDITGEPLSDLSDVTITTIASGELLEWDGGAWINQTIAELGLGKIANITLVSGQWTFTSATFIVGGSVGSPNLKITDDGSRDPRLAALGGKMTLETLGSTTATGDGLYIDDGGTTNAKIVGIKLITNSANTPTGDYPYGTLHLIY